jgi:lysine 2,3-aminomutase
MNQTVLLKGINDSSACMEKLCRALIRIRVKPYYLFQCDPASGTEHFHTSISNGIKIMEFLFRRLTGIGIPLYVVDLPHGAGKIPVIPGMK